MTGSRVERIGHRKIAVLGLRKKQSERVYRAARAQEQSWRDKRRVRDLDELHAKSGGMSGGAAGGGAAGDDPLARLQRAKEMLAAGLITDSSTSGLIGGSSMLATH
jgi:hypothetical protein